MNREIKFRAWCIDRFIYRGLHDRNWYTGPVGGVSVGAAMPNDKREMPIMQFTGLKDRHDIEIYEGDALRAHDDDSESCFAGIVTWFAEDDWLGWCLMNSWGPEMLCVRDQQNLEVIGNIHQNPELLNKVA